MIRWKQLNIWCIIVIALPTLLLVLIILFGSELRDTDTEELTSLEPTGHGLEQIINMLTNAVSIEPLHAVHKSCGASSISPEMPSCHGQSALSGKLLEKPRKIVLMLMFGFEVDTLEIALKQQQDLVDKIFLIESSYTHRGVSFKNSIVHYKILDKNSLLDKQNIAVGEVAIF